MLALRSQLEASNAELETAKLDGRLQQRGGDECLIYYHGPPKPTFLEVFMVHHMVFWWQKPVLFMVLGAHGRWWFQILIIFTIFYPDPWGR